MAAGAQGGPADESQLTELSLRVDIALQLVGIFDLNQRVKEFLCPSFSGALS